jgi:anti-sigma regulatory factor (Ser/Thr protein kinase)
VTRHHKVVIKGLDRQGKRIRIEAVDKGPGIENVDLAMQEGWSTAGPLARELGFGAGMGLPNIKRCADEFGIQSELGAARDCAPR